MFLKEVSSVFAAFWSKIQQKLLYCFNIWVYATFFT